MLFSFSNGVVYFIKNINKDEDLYLGFFIDTINIKFMFYHRTIQNT